MCIRDRVKVIHAGVGAISESDILLASTSNAIVVGFNVRPEPSAAAHAARDSVDVRMYRVIYDAIGEIEAAMKGMLAPKFREEILGHAEVRQTYKDVYKRQGLPCDPSCGGDPLNSGKNR